MTDWAEFHMVCSRSISDTYLPGDPKAALIADWMALDTTLRAATRAYKAE